MSMANVLDDVLGGEDEMSVHSSSDEGESIREVIPAAVLPSGSSRPVEDLSKAAKSSIPSKETHPKPTGTPKRKKTAATKEYPRKRTTAGRVLPSEDSNEDAANSPHDSPDARVTTSKQPVLPKRKGKPTSGPETLAPTSSYTPLWGKIRDTTLLDSPTVQLEWVQNALPPAEVSRNRDTTPSSVRERLVETAVNVAINFSASFVSLANILPISAYKFCFFGFQMVHCVANEIETFDPHHLLTGTGVRAEDMPTPEELKRLKDEAVNSRAAADDAKKELVKLKETHKALQKDHSTQIETERLRALTAETRVVELQSQVALLTEEKRFLLTEGIAQVVRCIFQCPEFTAWTTKAMKTVAEAGKSTGAMLMRKAHCPSVRTRNIPWYIKDAKELAAAAMNEVHHLSFSLLNTLASRPTMSTNDFKALCPDVGPSDIDLGLGVETDEARKSLPSAAV